MRLAIAQDQGTGPLVVLLHGFPELPHCWTAQLGPLVGAGYRVVVPYLRGYGPSPAPDQPAAYTVDQLAGDVAELIEACGQQQAIVVGHDWGAACAWASAELRPDRVRALAALSVPYTARPRRPPLARLAETFGDAFFYMLYFNEPAGRAEAELGAQLERFLLGTYGAWSVGAAPPLLRRGESLLASLPAEPARPPWLAEADLRASLETFGEHGLTGPLNYYRAMDLSWAQVPSYGTAGVRCPALFMAGALDPVLTFTPTRAMAPPLVGDLRADLRIAGAGHWLQREAPGEVNAALLDFLAALPAPELS